MEQETVTPEQLWNEVAAEREAPAAEEPQVAAQEVVAEQEVAAAPEEQKPEPVEEDPLAGVPQAVRDKLAALEKLGERMRNVEGHIGGLTSAQRQLRDTIQAAQSAQASVKEAPTDSQIKQAIKNPEAWDKLKEDFPEWGDATEAFVDARIAALKPAQAGVDPAQINQLIEQRLSEVSAVKPEDMLDLAFQDEEGNPTWQQTLADPAFDEWRAKQNADIQKLFFSNSVNDAAKMLRLYHRDSDPAKGIKQDRAQRLEAAAGTPKGSVVPRAKAPEEMSPDELWAYEAKQRDKQREARGY